MLTDGPNSSPEWCFMAIRVPHRGGIFNREWISAEQRF
jgi:hypothetical protein